uniref:Uncharacterized protein n=1 Tax=Zea mays TaxID=4577 RepID=B6TS24_MAIZE|nr:hypothetical protein [Zea mays]
MWRRLHTLAPALRRATAAAAGAPAASASSAARAAPLSSAAAAFRRTSPLYLWIRCWYPCCSLCLLPL